jgi:hypothetical protein
MFLGEAAHLTLALTNDAGVATDGTNVTLTILLPDGTPSDQTSLIQNDSTGNYHADYPTTVAGKHTARWHSDAPTPAALEDVFNVSAQWGRALVGMAEMKQHLNKSVLTTTEDAELRGFIAAVTPLVELICGPVAADLVARDEWYDGGSPMVALLSRPVLSVISVTETFGANAIRTLTEQPLDGVTSVDAYGYTIDTDTGIITRRISGIDAPFASGRRNVHVVYKAGRVVVPDNIQLAVKIVAAHMWETQRGRSGGRGPSANSEMAGTSAASTMVAGYGFAVPNRALELLKSDPYAGNFGIA